MLQLLKDPELTRFVLDYVLETPGGRRTVSRISRTCKAVSEMALNSLWKELDSLLPLLSLFPGHLFKRARRPGQGFEKPPQPEDWNRVLVHGDRVRKIAYNESVGNVHPGIFSIIEKTKPRDYILPNLKFLHWKCESSEGLERSKLFLNPQLRSVTLEVGGGVPQEDLAEFLSVVSSSTRLTSLSVTSPTRLPHYLPRLLQQQTTLEKVALMAPGALAPSIGRWLSSIPSLKSLQIEVGDRSDGVIASFFNGVPTSGKSSPGFVSPDFVMTPLSAADSTVLVNFATEPGFKQLRHLSISGELGSATNFLARVSAPLESIELALDEPDNEKEWRSLWLTVSRQFKNSLRSIVISPSSNSRFVDLIRSTTRGDNSARRLRLDGLVNTENSRVIFPQLTHFEVDLPQSRIFLDEDLQHLATACPKLQIVKLCPLSRWPLPYGPPKVTLTGLALLTAGCEQLHTLHIPIHAHRTDNRTLFEIETSSRSLTTLHLGHSWVDDPLNVAIHISHFAPYLENLKFFREKNRPGYVEAHCSGWQRVSEILPQLQQLRLHERSHGQTTGFTSRPAAPSDPASSPSFMRLPGTPPLRKTVTRAVQATPVTKEFAIQTKVNVRHKGISTKPVPSEMRDEGIDARPFVRDEIVQARPTMHEQAVEAQPLLVSKLVETLVIPDKVTADASTSPIREKFEEDTTSNDESSSAPSGYLARSADYLTQIVHAVSPPIFLRLFSLFNLWAIFRIQP
ncbi:uncharacterized protein FOMMEDRAFT_167038 [Fomitiporia mediterranea MF3/22]|uniref:uncharacterized protein n=1 Tax=Fomitiporia mediterranea (strain MF3/22) TaxID=694068 RepID=UPI000440991F|nr:uncharacterized protein FOMMEDRAFT_167038 [Fomitiporia mediterranea MF3/22]EJD03704.1 hypothetical protein FOMMEDRAFT_167038 [Fomitiporia mediterranea MF3/22]